MIPDEIVSKLHLVVMDEQYGDSILSGAQVAIFKKDMAVRLFDGGPAGILYLRNMYRIEKKLETQFIRLYIHRDHLIEAKSEIEEKLITHANSDISLDGIFL